VIARGGGASGFLWGVGVGGWWWWGGGGRGRVGGGGGCVGGGGGGGGRGGGTKNPKHQNKNQKNKTLQTTNPPERGPTTKKPRISKWRNSHELPPLFPFQWSPFFHLFTTWMPFRRNPTTAFSLGTEWLRRYSPFEASLSQSAGEGWLGERCSPRWFYGFSTFFFSQRDI